MKLIVIIGDVVDSRNLPDRQKFQSRLRQQLAATSRRASDLASPYTITLGDEFQAVYRKAGSVFADLVGIMAEAHPAQIRVSIGVGGLTTSVNPKQALGMDGPAFYAARETLSRMKKLPGLVRISGEAPAGWDLANRGLNLVTRQVRGWDKNRLVVLAALLRGDAVPKIASALGISKVAVYKNINAAALDDVVGLCHELTGALNAALRP
jgi:hypothetical protein